MRSWEPIDTAPRYGIKFRALLDDGREMEGISWWPFDGWRSSGGHRVNPTHWERPEPEPESDTAESLLRDIVNEQAEDEGLWFMATTAAEAYLQAALRRLHAAVEEAAERPDPPKVSR